MTDTPQQQQQEQPQVPDQPESATPESATVPAAVPQDAPREWVWSAVDATATARAETEEAAAATVPAVTTYQVHRQGGRAQPAVYQFGAVGISAEYRSDVQRGADWHSLINPDGLRVASFHVTTRRGTRMDARLGLSEKSLCGRHTRVRGYRVLSLGTDDELQAMFFRPPGHSSGNVGTMVVSSDDRDNPLGEPVGYGHLLVPVYRKALDAVERAALLLWRCLNSVQQFELAHNDGFTITGSAGTRFFLARNHNHNIRELRTDGSIKAIWCLMLSPGEWMPDDDILLAQKYAIETDEPRFRRVANDQAYSRTEHAELFDRWVSEVRRRGSAFSISTVEAGWTMLPRVGNND